MSIQVQIRNRCRLCDSEDMELGCPIKPTPVAEKYGANRQEALEIPIVGLDLYRCADCAHVQVLNIVDPTYLFNENYTYRSGQTKGIIEHFQDYAKRASNDCRLAEKDLVVEIGSNDGTLLKEFADNGASVLGVDPAGTIAAQASTRGIKTIPAFFTPELASQIKNRHGGAKLVVANNVFAHADDLKGIAEGISDLLAPDGVYMFEVSYLMDVLDKCLLGTIFHEHLSYHALAPMIGFLRRHGMKVIDVRRVGIQGGSIIVSAAKIDGPYSIRNSVMELLRLEKSRNLNSMGRLKDFSARLQELYQRTHQFVEKCQTEGARVGGFGGARSGTTLIAQLELQDTIEFIFDNHPDKVGKFSAGFGIEVLPVTEIAVRKPNYLMILAWIHAARIMETNSGFVEAGGKWVLCVPNLEIIPRNRSMIASASC